MAKTIQDTGKYIVRREDSADKGKTITFDYSFETYASVEDAVATLGAGEVLSIINRMCKVDARNTSSQVAQSKNGHSVRKEMTAEQKAESKMQRALDKAMLDRIKSKGLSAEDLDSLLA